MPGLTRVIDPVTRDYVRNADGTWKTTPTIATKLHHQLHTELGAWWGDPELGSRLHTLQPGKLTVSIGEEAKDIVEEAVRPFLERGEAEDLVVETGRDERGRLALAASVHDVQHGEIDLSSLLTVGA